MSTPTTVAPLFPTVDDSMDARFEDMVAGGVGVAERHAPAHEQVRYVGGPEELV